VAVDFLHRSAVLVALAVLVAFALDLDIPNFSRIQLFLHLGHRRNLQQ
jgi:hypothetical protein